MDYFCYVLFFTTFKLEMWVIQRYYHTAESNYDYMFTIASEIYAFCVFMLITILLFPLKELL